MLTVMRRLELPVCPTVGNSCCEQLDSFTQLGDTGAGAAPELQV